MLIGDGRGVLTRDGRGGSINRRGYVIRYG